MVTASGARFTCHACAACCRRYRVGLSAEERDRIAAHDWRREGQRFGRGWTVEGTDPWGEPQTQLRRRPDGACVFLDDDDLCRIHKRLGPAAKPRICRQFPFVFVAAPDGVRATVGVECLGLHRSLDDGVPLEAQRESLEALREEVTPHRTRWRVRRRAGGVLLSPEAYLALETELRVAVASGDTLEDTVLCLAGIAREIESETIDLGDLDARIERQLSAVLGVVEEDDDETWPPILRSPRPLSAVLGDLERDPSAARLLRHVLRTWIEQAVPGRARTFADGVDRMLLGAALIALHATHHTAPASPTAAATNLAARETSLLLWGRRQKKLDDALGY
jgi:Fe-S-cluster containining protein